jgi:hypothetical protein
MFLSNTRYGGIERRRPAQDAVISVELLDLANSALVGLCQIERALLASTQGDAIPEDVIRVAKRSRSEALEVRRIASMANHEKY